MILFLHGLLRKRLKINSFNPNSTYSDDKRMKCSFEKETNKNSLSSIYNRDKWNMVRPKVDFKEDWKTRVEENIKCLTERFDNLESKHNS